MHRRSPATRTLVGTAFASVVVLGSIVLPPAVQAQEDPPLPTAEDSALYALAVDPSEHPDRGAVILLDRGVLRVNADGTHTRRVRIVRQILTREAAESAAELTVGYDASQESFELEWARVVKPDGTVVAAEPIHVQEGDARVSSRTPVYTEQKRVRASLGAVAPGTIVDWQLTKRITDPPLPGDFGVRWSINGTPVLRSSFVLDVPEGMEPRITGTNVPGPTSTRREGDRVIREWAYEDVAPVEGEPFAADSNGIQQRLYITGDLEWNDVARWYAGLTGGRYEVTPELEERLREVTADAPTLEEKLRALHRWISQDVRYVSISLGIGGYQPRPAVEVAEDGAGDCKDKTTLFVALARHLGAEAHPVVVRSGGGVTTEHPTITQFNHMVAAVRWEGGGGWRYLDLTVPVVPWGEVFTPLQGEEGVMLRDDGTAGIVEFPRSPIGENRSSIVVVGSLSEDGDFVGHYTETVTGAIQYRIRAEFAGRPTERSRSAVTRNLAQRVFARAHGDSLELFDGRDLTATPRLHARVEADDVLREVSVDAYLLELKLPRYGAPDLIARLEDDEERLFPIDAEKVFGRRVHRTEYRIRLPEGWRADLPESVRAESAFGSYASIYEQNGRELVIVREVRGASGVHPPERIGELVDWLRAMSEDAARIFTLRPAAEG